jgi:hypothetical protein
MFGEWPLAMELFLCVTMEAEAAEREQQQELAPVLHVLTCNSGRFRGATLGNGA